MTVWLTIGNFWRAGGRSIGHCKFSHVAGVFKEGLNPGPELENQDLEETQSVDANAVETGCISRAMDGLIM
jgi:hypothetical protein